MSTTVNISGVTGPTGENQRARVYNPDGTTNGDIALAESPSGSGQYGGSGVLTLAETAAVPFEYEVRKVATQNDAGFTASTTVRRTRGELGYVVGGVLSGSNLLSLLLDGVGVGTILQRLNALARGKVVSTNNGDGTFAFAFKKEDGTTTLFTVTYTPSTGGRA